MKPAYAVGIILLRVVGALSPVALLWVGKLIVDQVVANIGLASPEWGALARLVALELVIAIAADAINRLSGLLESLLGDVAANRMSVRTMLHASSLDLRHFEDPEFFDKMQRARRQTSERVALISQVITIGQQSLTLLSFLSALVAFDPWLIGILTVAILPSFLGETAYAGIAYSFVFQWTPQRQELDYYRGVASDLEAAKEVKLFGLAPYLVRRYSDLADEYIAENRRVATHRTAVGAALTVISTLAYYGAVGAIVYRTVLGLITIGDFTFLIGSFQRSRDLIRGILSGIALSYEHGLHLSDFFDFLDVRADIRDQPDARPVPTPIRMGLVFDEVSFRYPDADGWALRDVSFEIRPGERIALVGENGAGKTTLVKLLTRLYEPTGGRILLDGMDLREFGLQELRAAVGVIFQDFFRYDLTARENIAVGWIQGLSNDARIIASARKSNASELIARLDRGYDQLLGRRFEGGANLSGGEWQKIALARAYMRDAQILVLDEPTAALDARAEHLVFERFADLTEGSIALLISHRFSTVRMADRIVVLGNGRVLETGSHEQLLGAGGHYAELFNLQARRYQ